MYLVSDKISDWWYEHLPSININTIEVAMLVLVIVEIKKEIPGVDFCLCQVY
jgi:hypothetical protein